MVLDICPRVVVLDAAASSPTARRWRSLADAALMEHHRLEVPYSLRRDHEHRFPLAGTRHAREH